MSTAPLPPSPPPDDQPLPLRPPPVAARPRLTVVSATYHQVPGYDADGVAPAPKYQRWLDSDEQAYNRTVRVGEAWEPLDAGWVGGIGASLLSLVNTTKSPFTRRPRPDEEEAEAVRCVVVGVTGNDGQVVEIGECRRGEELRLHPRSLDRYRVRSSAGESRYTVFVVPV